MKGEVKIRIRFSPLEFTAIESLELVLYVPRQKHDTHLSQRSGNLRSVLGGYRPGAWRMFRKVEYFSKCTGKSPSRRRLVPKHTNTH